MTKRKITEADGWLTDGRNNRASIRYFGSREAAEKALLSLKNCTDCENCTDCVDCADCASCTGLKNINGEPVSIPVIADIHAAIYAAASQPGALEMGAWHMCGNTHCRAGWAVALAGEEGRELEKRFNTELAAILIYRESGHRISPARFYDTNDEALKDMKRLAEASGGRG